MKIFKSKEAMLADHMEGFQDHKVDYSNFEVSFRRWIVSQIDGGHMTIHDIRDRFHLSRNE